ncbi:MAG: ATP-binding protein [Phycisphaeraceae bacterium]|nr:ATP-binding protein [Phycisphaeraceae bacterium]
MINKAIKDITSSDLVALVANGTEEGRNLEFKRELPGSADKDKAELCADVSSFANTAGGYILYGVEETNGAASAVPGLRDANPDATNLRLHQILSSGIDPPIPGVAFQAISTDSGAVVIAVHVPRSWRAPHLVKYRGSFRMYARTSNGKQPLDAQEIRRVFESTVSAAEAIRRWRDDRIAGILANDTPIRLVQGAKMVLHIVPLESLGDPFRFPASDLDGKLRDFMPLGVNGWDGRINLDGGVTHGGRPYGDPSSPDSSYCQIFRSGRIEAVFSELVLEHAGRRLIASIWYEKLVLEATARYIKVLAEVGVSYPIVVMLCFLEAREAIMAIDSNRSVRDVHPIDRDVLVFPDVVLDSAPADLPRALRPVFDAVWNASGIARSLNYDEKGNWTADHLSGVPLERV